MKIPRVFFAMLLCGCATPPLEFIPVTQLKAQQVIELPTIDDYEKLLEQKGIRTVYYTSEYFVVDVNSALYVLASRGYTNFHDYKEGRLREPDANAIFKPGYPLKRRDAR